jgi:hypothetical protein
MSGPKMEQVAENYGKLHDEQRNNLYSSPNINGMTIHTRNEKRTLNFNFITARKGFRKF